MSSDVAVEGRGWVTDTNVIIAVSLLLAFPIVLVLAETAGAGLRFVFLTTLAVGFFPAYIYSKLPIQYSPGKAAPWGLAVAVALLAVITGIWYALLGPLGSDGASIVAFAAVTLAIYGWVKLRNRSDG